MSTNNIKFSLRFEIANKSTKKCLTWHEAVEYCKSLGSGWRLPTKDELNQIYNSKNNFTKDFYWSSTEFDNSTACLQYFNDGTQYNVDKNDDGYVRAIRDVL